MSKSFNRSFNKTLNIEGGESNHPKDTGGHTMYGITEELARSYDYEGDMADLPLEKAKSIYQEEFWDENNLDEIAKINEQIAFEIFDTAVNCGNTVAGKFFQRCLNAFNREGELYGDIEVDGDIGPNTLEAWNKYFKNRRYLGGDMIPVMLDALNGLQASYYVRLCEEDDDYENFVVGWIRLRVNSKYY